jgi:phosphopantetheinyl transferase (holo-ACP synthase)
MAKSRTAMMAAARQAKADAQKKADVQALPISPATMQTIRYARSDLANTAGSERGDQFTRLTQTGTAITTDTTTQNTTTTTNTATQSVSQILEGSQGWILSKQQQANTLKNSNNFAGAFAIFEEIAKKLGNKREHDEVTALAYYEMAYLNPTNKKQNLSLASTYGYKLNAEEQICVHHTTAQNAVTTTSTATHPVSQILEGSQEWILSKQQQANTLKNSNNFAGAFAIFEEIAKKLGDKREHDGVTALAYHEMAYLNPTHKKQNLSLAETYGYKINDEEQNCVHTTVGNKSKTRDLRGNHF